MSGDGEGLAEAREAMLREVSAEDDRQYVGGSMHGLGALDSAEMGWDAALAHVAARLADPEVVEAVRWNLVHYGPLDAEPFQFSRFESPAHAALAAVAGLVTEKV